MKLKEKIQRFWTLSKNRKGFTLVELIVVIAILAILAGVAIPVYNGYIKKAQSAADQQLLDSISTAFAAACLTNGYDHVNAVGTTLAVKADGTVATVANDTVSYGFAIKYEGAPVDQTVATEIVTTFATFFAGNETAAFKGDKISGLVLNDKGVFEVSDSVKLAGYITVSLADRDTLRNSVWADVGSEKLLNMIDLNADVVAGMGTYEALVASGVLVAHAEDLLGVTYDKFVEQELKKREAEYKDLDPREQAKKIAEIETEIKADTNRNLMVLLTAKDAQQAGTTIIDDLRNNIGAGKGKDMLLNNLNGANNSDKTMGLSQSALTYGLYTAYKGGEGDVGEMLYELNDSNSGFFKYLNGENGANPEEDLEGLLAAMNIINSQSTDTKKDVVTNGFDIDENTALYDALTELLGKK